jgi:hypothetical protein
MWERAKQERKQMSRIILEKFAGTDEPRYVVGWDRPLSTYFWQEFHQEPVIVCNDDDRWQLTSYSHKVRVYKTQAEAEEHKWDDWEEMVAYAGYMPSELATLQMFRQSLPRRMESLITEEVEALLVEHSMAADPGSIIVDLTDSNVVMATSYKVEVQVHGETRWSSNALRFATEPEAIEAAKDLQSRWTMMKEWRVVGSADPVNYKWEDGRAISASRTEG